MVGNIALTPLPLPLTGFLRGLRRSGVEEQVVDLILSELAESLLSKRLHSLQIGQLERQDGQAVLRAVIGDLVVCLLGSGRVSGAEYDLVGLRLA